jgi:hypothetical protein
VEEIKEYFLDYRLRGRSVKRFCSVEFLSSEEHSPNMPASAI